MPTKRIGIRSNSAILRNNRVRLEKVRLATTRFFADQTDLAIEARRVRARILSDRERLRIKGLREAHPGSERWA